jgi:hypothetical protein
MANKTIWTSEKVRLGFNRFFEENNRYPTTREIDAYQHLPSSKQLQRKYGGVQALRSELNIPITNFCAGATRTEKAKEINQRAEALEISLNKKLRDTFGERNVHRESPISDDRRSRCDFLIFAKDKTASVDIFFASDKHSLLGCINHKLKKYNLTQAWYETIFVQMNPHTTQADIDDTISRKKTPLPDFIKVMSLDSFNRWLSTLTPQE